MDDNEDPPSPPRRRAHASGRSRPSAPRPNATSRPTATTPSLATIFHGLQPPVKPQKSRFQGAVPPPRPPDAISSESARDPKRVSSSLAGENPPSRPPTRPAAPIKKHISTTSKSSTSAPLLPAFKSPRPHQHAVASSSPLPPLTESDHDARDEQASSVYAEGEKRRTEAAKWAARVLSPIARGEASAREQTDNDEDEMVIAPSTSRKRKKVLGWTPRVEDSEEGEEHDQELLSVDDFLKTATTKKRNKVGRKYGGGPKSKKKLKNPYIDDEAGEGAERTRRKPRSIKRVRVRRDYSSYSSPPPPSYASEESEDELAPIASRLPDRRTIPSTLRSLSRLPKFAGANSPAATTRGGHLIAPYTTFRQPPKLELVAYTCEGSDGEDYHAHDEGAEHDERLGRRMTWLAPGTRSKVFVRSLKDTSFAGVRENEQEGTDMRQEREKKATRKRRRETMERKSVTERMPAREEVEKLIEEEEITDGVGSRKKRRGGKGRKEVLSKFPALEMGPLTEEDMEDDSDEPPVPEPTPPQVVVAFPRKLPNEDNLRARARARSLIGPLKSDKNLKEELPVTSKSSPIRRTPLVLVPNTASTAKATGKSTMRASIHGKIPTAPIREEGSDLEEEDVPEPPLNRLDAIALLPTPSAPAFRFVIGGDQSTRNYEKHYNEQQENGEKENAVHERPEINWGAADEYELALTGVLDSEGGRGELFGPSPSEKAVFGGQEDIEEQHVARAEHPATPINQVEVVRANSTRPSTTRHVTFSSPPRPSPLRPARTRTRTRSRQRPPPTFDPTPPAPNKPVTPILARSKSFVLPPPVSSGSTTSDGKILRRMTLRPSFKVPMGGVEDNQKQDTRAEAVDHAVPEPSPPAQQASQTPPTPPPAAQPRPDEPYPLIDDLPSTSKLLPSYKSYGKDSRSTSVESEEGEVKERAPSNSFEIDSFPYEQYIEEAELQGAPTVVERSQEDVDMPIETSLAQQYEPTAMAPTERDTYSGDSMWDHYSGNGEIQPEVQAPAAPLRISSIDIPLDPNAIVSLPSSFRERERRGIPKRATTVWGGIRLDDLVLEGFAEWRQGF